MHTPIDIPPVVLAPKSSIDIDDLPAQWEGEGVEWPANSGDLHVVSFSFPQTLPDDWEEVINLLSAQSYQGFNDAAQEGADLAMRQWSEVSNLAFFNAGATNLGQIRFLARDMGTPFELNGQMVLNPSPGSAYGRHPDEDPTNGRDGDITINTLHNTANQVLNGADPGEFAFRLLMHEIGHALNFDHPGDYDAGDGATYFWDAEYYEDSLQYTIMSYFPEDETGADFNGASPDSLMLHDIYVVQQVYGEDDQTRLGNTRYGYNATLAGDPIHDWSVNTDPVYAIWDAGGADDWLDLSGDTNGLGVDLDLRQGHFSSTHGMTDNIAIAYGTSIENAVGGIRADVIYGNMASNELRGGGSTDQLFGLRGNDLLFGEDGFDSLEGGRGHDIMVGGTGNDTLIGGHGEDTLVGGEGNDSMDGGARADSLVGDDGNDTMAGGSGNDTLEGGAGADDLIGGSGEDTASYRNADAGVVASLFNPGQNTGAAEGDTYASIEVIEGSRFDDTLRGGEGDNTLDGRKGADALNGREGDDSLRGGGGADSLRGREGNDTLDGGGAGDLLIGGDGDDSLTGGGGGDEFRLNTGDGTDTITDFQIGNDVIGLQGVGISFAGLSITQDGNDAVVAFADVEIILIDRSAGDLSASDFLL